MSAGTRFGPEGSSRLDAAELVLPIERDDRATLEFEDWVWEVDPRGARVCSFRFRGREVLGGVAPCDGSTFWTSPQSDWGWPPLEELDSAPYSVTTVKVGTELPSIQMKSRTVSLKSPRGRVEFALTKRFSADLAGRAVLVEYVLEASQGSLRLAPWEVTRLGPGGLCVFPLGPGGVSQQSTLALSLDTGFAWFDHAAWTGGESQKAFADGTGGYVAHFTHDLMLLKTFSDVMPGEQAPGEAEVELYSDASGSYIELEHQGRFEELRVGMPLRYQLRWQLRPVPSSVPVKLGEQGLLDFVQQHL